MKEKTVIQPTGSINRAFGRPTVFLAGSIEMDRAENWQVQAENLLAEDFVLFNPRRASWDSSWEQEMSNPVFKGQVDWELDALEKADHVLMYFSPGTQSPVSLLELGLYARSGKMVVACPKGFWRRGNVEIVCHRFDIPFFETLEEAAAYLLKDKKMLGEKE